MAETKSESKLVDKLETEEDLLTYAKLAEQAERYDDMAKAMAKMIKLKKDGLNTECRNLFSVAYKNVVGARRSSWRVISMIEQKAGDEHNKKLSKEMREHVEKELNETCNAVLSHLDTLLAKSDGDDEEKVFYYKMKGDYCRYMAEYVADEKPKNDALEAYEAATEVAKNSTKMDAIHPNRLGLALNFSVFYYEICNEPDKACKLAKEAFDEAIDLMDHNSMKGNDDNKDSTLIMQLLRDNLTLWTSDTGAENGADQQD